MAKTKRKQTQPAKPGSQAASQAARQQTQSVKPQSQAARQPTKPQGQPVRQQNRQRYMARKRNPWPYIGGTLVLVAAVIGLFIYLSNQHGSSNPSATGTPTDAATFQEVTNVNLQLLDQIGTGGIASPFKLTQGSPSALTGPTGKPEVFYYGAEWCPFCAAERWSIIVALSHFGTFHTLTQVASASNDSYPSTATFTFYQSGYTSQYIDFVSIEIQDQQRATLQTPTASEQQLVNTYDGPPYVAAQSAGGFPFVDIGNRYLISGPSYDAGVLRTNSQDPSSAPLSQQAIASQLATNNTLSQNVLGVANYLTASFCAITQNQPGSVCGDTTIQHIEASLSQTGQSHVPSGNLPVLAQYTIAADRDLRYSGV